MTSDISLVLAFTAGLLSFLSPCVLPLIPSYLSILGGFGFNQAPKAREAVVKEKTEDPAGQGAFSFQPRLIKAALAFIFGFSAVFILMGVLISSTFSLMGGVSRYINQAAGIIVIVLGLNVIFDFITFLNYEKRPFFKKSMPGIRGMLSAFLAGLAFGAGWTPCIGPILAGILLLASGGGRILAAVFYLTVYSAGLALPFLLAAMFFDSFLKHGDRIRTHLPLIRRVSGILLIVIGLMILTGRYSALNILIQKSIFSYIGWAEAKALPFRVLANFLVWLQNF